MMIEKIKEMSPSDFSPVDIILHWDIKQIGVYFGEVHHKSIKLHEQQMELLDESADKILLVDFERFGSSMVAVLSQAKRILKRDGRIFIVIKNGSSKGGLLNLIKTKLGMKQVIDEITGTINALDLLIDKNFIDDQQTVYFELVKPESEYIKRRIAI